MTKLRIESESVVGLRNQLEYIQTSGQQVNWVTHSRGGAEFVQAASGSLMEDMSKNKVVFHAGANTRWATDDVMQKKKIGDLISDGDRYRDAPNDLVPQFIGLRAIFSPIKLVGSLLSSPCLSDLICSIQKSPHTLPYQWSNLNTKKDE